MNKNISITLTFLIIFLAAYLLYWQGEASIQKAASKFTAIGFENTKMDCTKSSLDFFIENNQKEERTYKIQTQINDKDLETETATLMPLEKKIIKADKDEIKRICEKKEYFKYQITVKEEDKKQTIYKRINPNSK